MILTKATRTLAPKPLARQGTPAVNSSGVIVEDIGSCMIKFSRCCTPVPGDEIIGFISTKGYGVSVHRKDCPNARAALDPAQKGRWVKVTWAEAPDVMFSTSLEIEADDRDGLMLDVCSNSHVFASAHKRNECTLCRRRHRHRLPALRRA